MTNDYNHKIAFACYDGMLMHMTGITVHNIL